MIKEILFADTHNYHGKVDERFIDLATQFSRLQDARSHQGGAALVVYFKGQKVVDIFTGKKSQEEDWQSNTLTMCYSTGKGILATIPLASCAVKLFSSDVNRDEKVTASVIESFPSAPPEMA